MVFWVGISHLQQMERELKLREFIWVSAMDQLTDSARRDPTCKKATLARSYTFSSIFPTQSPGVLQLPSSTTGTTHCPTIRGEPTLDTKDRQA